MPPHIIFQDIIIPLRFTHAVFGFTAAAATVHLFLRSRPFAAAFEKKIRLHAVLTAVSLTGALVTGFMIYPDFRYFRRGLQLDHHAPTISNIFDMKENIAVLMVPLILLLWLLAKKIGDSEPFIPKIYLTTALAVAAGTVLVAAMGVAVALWRV